MIQRSLPRETSKPGTNARRAVCGFCRIDPGSASGAPCRPDRTEPHTSQRDPSTRVDLEDTSSAEPSWRLAPSAMVRWERAPWSYRAAPGWLEREPQGVQRIWREEGLQRPCLRQEERSEAANGMPERLSEGPSTHITYGGDLISSLIRLEWQQISSS